MQRFMDYLKSEIEKRDKMILSCQLHLRKSEIILVIDIVIESHQFVPSIIATEHRHLLFPQETQRHFHRRRQPGRPGRNHQIRPSDHYRPRYRRTAQLGQRRQTSTVPNGREHPQRLSRSRRQRFGRVRFVARRLRQCEPRVTLDDDVRIGAAARRGSTGTGTVAIAIAAHVRWRSDLGECRSIAVVAAAGDAAAAAAARGQ